MQNQHEYRGMVLGLISAILYSASDFSGGFLVLIYQASGMSSYWPLVMARVASISVVLVFVVFTQRHRLPNRQVLPLMAAAGTLDMVSNFFFVWSGQSGRLNLASVLSSFDGSAGDYTTS